MSNDPTLTTSTRIRDVPEVPVVNLTYTDPPDLASGYAVWVEDQDS